MSQSTHKMLRAATKANTAVLSQLESIGVCCRHFFPMGETSGTTITDVVGGVVYTPATAPTFNADGSVHFGNDYTSIALTSGAWFDFTGKDFMLLSVATGYYPSAPTLINQTVLGGTDAGESSLSITVATDTTITFDNGTTESKIIFTDGAVEFDLAENNIAIIGDRNGDLRTRITGDITEDGTVNMSSATGIQPAAEMLLGRQENFGVALFTFADGLPATTDLEAWIDAMATQWRSEPDGAKRLISAELLTYK